MNFERESTVLKQMRYPQVSTSNDLIPISLPDHKKDPRIRKTCHFAATGPAEVRSGLIRCGFEDRVHNGYVFDPDGLYRALGCEFRPPSFLSVG